MTWDAAIVVSAHIFYKQSGRPLSLAAGAALLYSAVTICLFAPAPFSLTGGFAENNPVETLQEAFNCGSG